MSIFGETVSIIEKLQFPEKSDPSEPYYGPNLFGRIFLFFLPQCILFELAFNHLPMAIRIFLLFKTRIIREIYGLYYIRFLGRFVYYLYNYMGEYWRNYQFLAVFAVFMLIVGIPIYKEIILYHYSIFWWYIHYYNLQREFR